MKTLAIAVLAGAAALSVGSAKASDVHVSEGYAYPELVQQIRTVCDEYGRCYRTSRGKRVIIRDSYRNSYNYYAPRDHYYERRVYRDYDGPSIGIHAPGVSVGVGVDRW